MITGTLALDYIAQYPNSFSKLTDHVGINVSTRIEHLERQFGGCAMNMAYSLNALGHRSIPFVMCGKAVDASYLQHIRNNGIDERGIVQLPDWSQSSHGFIFTDRDNNQFTAFFSGPAETTEYSTKLESLLGQVHEEVDFAILGPDIARNMIDATALMNRMEIPCLCDPGQQIADFSDQDCLKLIELANCMIGNEFEMQRLQSVDPDFDQSLDVLIVTKGKDGASWTTNDEKGEEHAVAPAESVDPTGCGDAFRAGLVHGWLSGASWRDAVRSGASVASVNLECAGSQTHDLSDFVSRFENDWGYVPSWLTHQP